MSSHSFPCLSVPTWLLVPVLVTVYPPLEPEDPEEPDEALEPEDPEEPDEALEPEPEFEELIFLSVSMFG
jgi:hypothetical protein